MIHMAASILFSDDGETNEWEWRWSCERSFFCFILQLCIGAMMTQRYRQQSRCWWRVLSVFTNLRLWIHIAEHALSLPPQTPSFVSLLRPNLITNFVAVIRLGSLGITAVSQFLFVFCFPALSHCVFPLSFSLWVDTYRGILYQDCFVTHCVLTFTQSSP